MTELSSVAKGHQRIVDWHAQGPDFVVVLQHGPDLLRGAAGRGEVAGGGGTEEMINPCLICAHVVSLVATRWWGWRQ